MVLRILTALALCAMVQTGDGVVAAAEARSPTSVHHTARLAQVRSAPLHPMRLNPPRRSVPLRIAQACLSQSDARQAVQSGQVNPLSTMMGNIRAQAGGKVLPNPKLCHSGGGLVYLINILTGGGKVRQMTVDALTGAILGY